MPRAFRWMEFPSHVKDDSSIYGDVCVLLAVFSCSLMIYATSALTHLCESTPTFKLPFQPPNKESTYAALIVPIAGTLHPTHHCQQTKLPLDRNNLDDRYSNFFCSNFFSQSLWLNSLVFFSKTIEKVYLFGMTESETMIIASNRELL